MEPWDVSRLKKPEQPCFRVQIRTQVSNPGLAAWEGGRESLKLRMGLKDDDRETVVPKSVLFHSLLSNIRQLDPSAASRRMLVGSSNPVVK